MIFFWALEFNGLKRYWVLLKKVIIFVFFLVIHPYCYRKSRKLQVNLTYIKTYMLPGVISRLLTCKLNLVMPIHLHFITPSRFSFFLFFFSFLLEAQLVHNLHRYECLQGKC